MKKLFVVLALAAFLAAGTAFADHPDGFGVGVQGGGGGGWEGGGFGFYRGASLSLKIPNVPVFWAIDLEINKYFFGLGVSGDFYFVDAALVKDIGLNWYIGFGVGVGLGFYNGDWPGDDNLWLRVVARLPVGLSWQLPINAGPLDAFEVYLQVVPSLGVAIVPEFHFPAGGWPINIGLRLWF